MYAFNAALYCDNCGEKIIAALTVDGTEDTGDTDEYPQYANEDQSETDCPSHCDDCGELLRETLTGDGLAYVAQAIVEYITTGRGDGDTIEEWADAFNLSSIADLREAFRAVKS